MAVGGGHGLLHLRRLHLDGEHHLAILKSISGYFHLSYWGSSLLDAGMVYYKQSGLLAQAGSPPSVLPAGARPRHEGVNSTSIPGWLIVPYPAVSTGRR